MKSDQACDSTLRAHCFCTTASLVRSPLRFRASFRQGSGKAEAEVAVRARRVVEVPAGRGAVVRVDAPAAATPHPDVTPSIPASHTDSRTRAKYPHTQPTQPTQHS